MIPCTGNSYTGSISPFFKKFLIRRFCRIGLGTQGVNPLGCDPAKTPEKWPENRGPMTKSQIFSEDGKNEVGHQTSETRRRARPVFAVGPDRNADVCYELWAFLYGLFLT
jgi:hypothetical protein